MRVWEHVLQWISGWPAATYTTCRGTAVHRPNTLALTHTGAPFLMGVLGCTWAQGSWNWPQLLSRSLVVW